MAHVLRRAPAFCARPVALVVVCVVPGGLLAQTASGSPSTRSLSEVQVTAPAETPYKAESTSPKFTAPLLDTPRSVTIITQELIEERGAASLTDILRTTPGITLGSGEGGTPLGDRPFIRGYEASTDILIDGMRDLARFPHEAFNLEAVEIIKGPGSAYSGRGSTGGSINLVSKTPKNYNFTHLSAGVGTHSNYRGTVDSNWAFANDTALRINLMKRDGNVAGRNGVEAGAWGFAPSFSIGLAPSTRAILSYYHVKTDDIPDLGLPFSAPGLAQPPDVDRKNFYGLLGRDFRKTQADLGTLKLTHEFDSGWKLSNSTRIGQTQNDYIVTRPSFDAPASFEARTVSQALRASRRQSDFKFNQTDITGSFAIGGLRHTVAAGLEYSAEAIKAGGYGNVGNTATSRTSLDNPDPSRPTVFTNVNTYGPFPETPYGEPTKTFTRAAYVFDTVKFSEQWEVNAGLRFDSYTAANEADKRQDDLWNYQLGLIYKPAPNGSVYLSYGTSSNPSGETAAQSGGADGPAGGGLRDLAPEKSRSWELGTKWELMDRRLGLNAALFQTRKTDARSFDPLTGTVQLTGNNKVTGLELSAIGNVSAAWQLTANYTYLDPKLTSYFSNATTNFNGNQLKFIAKQSFGLWTTYRVTDAITVGGGANYVGKRFVDDANTRFFDPYWRYDAVATYRVNRNLDFRLNVQNLFNETIYDASHVGVFAVVAPGRSALLTANYRF